MEACCCSRLPPVLVSPVAAAGDRRSAISSSSSSTGYGGGGHCLPMWAGLRWTYGPGSFHGSRLRVARTTSSSKRVEMGCLSFEIRSAMLAKIQSGSASPSCVAATASECLKSFVQGGIGTAPGSKDVAKRLFSVIVRAGHSKKRAKSQGSGGRIEGGQGKRRLDVKRGRNSAPGKFRNDGQPSDLKPQGAATKDKYRNGAPEGRADREVASDSGKRTRGPKPRVRVTLAGRPVEVVEKEALGPDVQLWTSDPGVRHPDDYYKYGPFGPHAWKGLVVGTPRKGTFADELAVFFSSVKNQEELEEIEIVNSIVGYENKLRQFDESISTQYYFAFVRSTYKATTSYQMPWEEWTLVAQIAIESANELDKWRLGFQLDRSMRDNLTRCVAWYRPDLIYVRRPSYQVRFEPQHEFLTVLVELLNPDNDAVKSSSSSSKNPYFERMCEILGVGENDDEEQIGIKFKNLSEEMKSHCLEHVLGMHPVELLTPFTRRAAQEDCAKREGQGRKINGGVEAHDDRDEGFDEGGDLQYGYEERSVDSQVEEEEEDFGDEEYGEDSDEEGDDGQWDGEDWENEEWKPSLTEEDVGQTDEGDSDNNMEYRNKRTAEGYSEIEKDSSGEKEGDECTGKGKDGSELLLKAAVRPYTYADLIKEIIFIRRTLLQYPALR
ncbi:unnamed protein product [Sphagnum jensenii]